MTQQKIYIQLNLHTFFKKMYFKCWLKSSFSGKALTSIDTVYFCDFLNETKQRYWQ